MKLNKNVLEHLRETWNVYIWVLAVIGSVALISYAIQVSADKDDEKQAAEISRVRDITICEAKGYIPMQKVGAEDIICVDVSYPVKEFYADLSGTETD